MPLSDAADAFGKTLGEKAANGLWNKIRGFFDREGLENERLVREILDPTFQKFQEVYAEYEGAFRGYRTELAGCRSSGEIAKVVSGIEGDLGFTARTRVDLLAQLEQAKGTPFEDYVRAISDFLVCGEGAEGDTTEHGLAEPLEVATQVHRRALIADLGVVTHANWGYVLDPSASGPPLGEEAVKMRLGDLGLRHGISPDDPDRDGKLRATLAVERLDARVASLVTAYKNVRIAHDALVDLLSR